MAIPVYLQQFKAAGVYRVVFDKSTILNTDTQILRLVVGYSEKGPFNIPVLVRDPQEFKAYFGEPSKKLEKRGIFFHRMALQMLRVSPILCLNLKKFDGETVSGSTISTDFNSGFSPIDTVKLNVEDIYDTVRFWELNADKLNNLRAVDGTVLDQYINIATTNTKSTSVSYFIRKASGRKVAGYNITVNDWYSDNHQEIPEFLEGKENNLISDFYAEIYVFKGRFTAKQVLASETLKNYFNVSDESDENGQPILKLKSKIFNAFGDPIDTLDALYNDETSNAIGHWIGCLIPDFKNKQGAYEALDIVFNNDQDVHNCMMTFNRDLLDEGEPENIDLSGRLFIPTDASSKLSLKNIFDGKGKTTVLGNSDSPVIADVLTFGNNIYDFETQTAIVPFSSNKKTKINGTLYVAKVDEGDEGTGILSPSTVKVLEIETQVVKYLSQWPLLADCVKYEELKEITNPKELKQYATSHGYEEPADFEAAVEKKIFELTLMQVGGDVTTESVVVVFDTKNQLYKCAEKLGIAVKSYYTSTDAEVTAENSRIKAGDPKELILENGIGTYWQGTEAFLNPTDPMAGPEKIITSISRLEGGFSTTEDIFTDIDENLKVSFTPANVMTNATYKNEDGENSVYNSSVTFIDFYDKDDNNWAPGEDERIHGVKGNASLVCRNYWDRTLMSVLQTGDCILAEDGTVDYNGDENPENDKDSFYDNVYVQEMGTEYYTQLDIVDEKDLFGKSTHEVGDFKFHYVIFSGTPKITVGTENNNYLIRIDNGLNQEIGTMIPVYLEGYTYKNDKPAGTGMYAKLQWQEFILSALTDYKGLRTGLLNKAEIDYRYVIDTFESYPDAGLKNVLSFLTKEKQSALCISNFPSVQTFIKCPYTSFTDSKGIFNINYIVEGWNKKKAAAIKFSLPTDSDGASFIAFYTPLKFSDGYVDSVIPSAGLVSNLFIEKYLSRQPYYIVAGPNYGSITAAGLIGPDYRYSMDELQVIEPFGVNCMVYRPNFGTFINANQTAKQVPVSALSKVHVRELVIYIQDEIEKVLQAYQWEFNNSRTRNAILDKANNICELVMANGGLQAYHNVMDESNNTPEIIDNEMAILSTHIEPGMGCGKMVQELTLYRTGQMAANILD